MSGGHFAGVHPEAQLDWRRDSGHAPTVRGDAEQRLAWQREMERAQLTAWFKPLPDPVAAAPGDTRATLHEAPASAREDGLHLQDRRSTDRHIRFGPDRASASGVRPLGDCAVAPMLAVGTRTVPELPSSVGSSNGCAEMRHAPAASSGIPTRLAMFAGESMASAVNDLAAPGRPKHGEPFLTRWDSEEVDVAELPSALRPSSAPAPTSMPQPVRLHAETTARGESIWIAMRADDHELNAMLPRIVADLQAELQARGQHLTQVVCNGRLFWREAAPTAVFTATESRADRSPTPTGPQPTSFINHPQAEEA